MKKGKMRKEIKPRRFYQYNSGRESLCEFVAIGECSHYFYAEERTDVGIYRKFYHSLRISKKEVAFYAFETPEAALNAKRKECEKKIEELNVILHEEKIKLDFIAMNLGLVQSVKKQEKLNNACKEESCKK